jgi:succinyl-diaminopimelate desuccinylase
MLGLAAHRTGGFPRRQVVLSVSPDAHETVVRLARDLIRIPSLTPITSDLRPASARSLALLKSYCEAAGAHCEWLTFEGGHARWDYPVDNLHVEWAGGADAGPGGLCFLGHTDVVPPGEAAAWRRDPFSGAIENGFLHGRGATDMKGAVAAFAVAAATCAAGCADAAKRPAISLVITTDEEWAAVNGTRRVLEWMDRTGRRPSAFVVGEPSSQEHLGESIKLGRRGSLCGTLHASGVQGHAAYPGLFRNSNRALSLAIAILHDYRWTDGEEGMPATSFETIAIESGDFGATAIVPGAARALWNIRFTHRESPSTLTRKLQERLDNPPQWAMDHPDAPMLRHCRLSANSDTAAMSYYSPPGALAALASQTVARNTGRQPVLDCRGGTTDGRFIHAVFPQAQIIELGLPECGGLTRAGDPRTFGTVGGMHQVDECCSLSDLATLMWCYRDLLMAFPETAP